MTSKDEERTALIEQLDLLKLAHQAGFRGGALANVTRYSCKDGLDIEAPSHTLVAFAKLIANALQLQAPAYRDNLGPWSDDEWGHQHQQPRVVRNLRDDVPNGVDVVRRVLALCPRNEDADEIVSALNRPTQSPQVSVTEAMVLLKEQVHRQCLNGSGCKFPACQCACEVDAFALQAALSAVPAGNAVQAMLLSTADYLDDLQNNMLRNDADMRMDRCKAPEIVAEELRAFAGAAVPAGGDGLPRDNEDDLIPFPGHEITFPNDDDRGLGCARCTSRGAALSHPCKPSEPSDGELREILAKEVEAQGLKARCVSARELDLFDRMVTASIAAMRKVAQRSQK